MGITAQPDDGVRAGTRTPVMARAPLFERLSDNFEQCVYGLNRVKNELQEMQHPIVRRTNELLT